MLLPVNNTEVPTITCWSQSTTQKSPSVGPSQQHRNPIITVPHISEYSLNSEHITMTGVSTPPILVSLSKEICQLFILRNPFYFYVFKRQCLVNNASSIRKFFSSHRLTTELRFSLKPLLSVHT